jgi:hypothetical protein
MRKNIVKDYVSLKNGDMTQSQLLGLESNVSYMDTISYLFSWSGGSAINGVIGINGSTDGINFLPLDFGTTIVNNGTSGNHRLIINTNVFNFLQPYFTNSGTASGLLTIELFSSTVGA